MACLSVLSSPVLALPVLNVVIADDYPPFYYRDETGAFRGASYEIVVHLAQGLGFEVTSTQVPSMRVMLAELNAGRQHISVNLTATDARRKVALFTTTPHIFETQNLITRADTELEYEGDLEQLKGYRYGPIFGWTYGPAFDSAQYLDKVYVNDSADQLRWLLSGQFDVAVNNRQFFQHMAQEMGVSRAFRILDPPVHVLPVTIAISHQYPGAEALRDELDKAVVSFIQTDEYMNILLRYGFLPEAQERE